MLVGILEFPHPKLMNDLLTWAHTTKNYIAWQMLTAACTKKGRHEILLQKLFAQFEPALIHHYLINPADDYALYQAVIIALSENKPISEINTFLADHTKSFLYHAIRTFDDLSIKLISLSSHTQPLIINLCQNAFAISDIAMQYNSLKFINNSEIFTQQLKNYGTQIQQPDLVNRLFFQANPLNELPKDILKTILSYLPVDAIKSLMVASKGIYVWLSEPSSWDSPHNLIRQKQLQADIAKISDLIRTLEQNDKNWRYRCRIKSKTLAFGAYVTLLALTLAILIAGIYLFKKKFSNAAPFIFFSSLFTMSMLCAAPAILHSYKWKDIISDYKKLLGPLAAYPQIATLLNPSSFDYSTTEVSYLLKELLKKLCTELANYQQLAPTSNNTTSWQKNYKAISAAAIHLPGTQTAANKLMDEKTPLKQTQFRKYSYS